MSILFKYFLKSIGPFFWVILGVIYSIFAFRQIQELIPIMESTNIDIADFLILMLLGLPIHIIGLLPIALVISLYYTCYNLSVNSEFVGMQSLGISLKLVMRTVLLLSGLVGVITLVFTIFINPISYYKLIKMQQNILQNQLKINFNAQSINVVGSSLVYFQDKDNNNDLMSNVLIKSTDSTNDLIIAKTGQFNFLTNNYLEVILKNGLILDSGKDRVKGYFFDEAKIPLKLPSANFSLGKLLEQEDRWYDINYLIHKSPILLNVSDFVKIFSKIDLNHPRARIIILELLNRIIPFFSCIAFGLFAMSLGIVKPREPKNGNLIILLAGILGYINSLDIIRRATITSQGSPFLIMVPPVIFLLVGLLLFYYANKNKSFNLYGILKLFKLK
ncbi:MAG: LptF/LptG family permease [SAR324 cluster bacterium]|nr:LptF/LptG family permease [SAR324 cluster bacterium]